MANSCRLTGGGVITGEGLLTVDGAALDVCLTLHPAIVVGVDLKTWEGVVLTGGGATFPIAEGEKLDTCWEVGVLTRGGAILSSSDFCLALYPAIAEGKKLYSCWEEGLLTEGGIMLLVSGVCLFWLSAIADEGNLHTFWEGEN